ncbi:MAG: winged helix-turn-helix domain-containing protein [Acidimicrobiia bacterium]|nr:winged helix-turn-helix domain-containing protein [Acidimicrobiia bacterium]
MLRQDADLLRFLGPLEVVVGGRAAHPGGPKQRALLCHLVLHAGEPVSIAALVEAVWGVDAPDGAIRSLRTYVSNLRRLLGPAADLRGEQGTYRLDLRSIETDIDRFRAAVKEAATLEDPRERSTKLGTALDLWRGAFLADVDRPWVQEESSILEWERQRAIVEWAEATMATGHPAQVIPVIERAAAVAPLDEQLCGLLMRALYGSGRQADALAVYRRLRDNLALDLGVEPGSKLRTLEEQILLHDASMDGAELQWLPAPTADLVGRRVELEDLLARIEQVRLLTLTGPGGVGKTRLAMEVGSRIVERGDQPVFFADLSTVFDESVVDAILASSAGVQPHPDSGPLASMIEYLRPRSALLIVDNCEHLASTVARSLAALVRSCPQLTLLATSRAPLHIDGELEWRTPSLPLPDRADAPISELRQWPAVELLLRRAPSSFLITDANRGDVVELCRRLDGLPLALELAASQLGPMTPAEIIATLGSRVQMSRGGPLDDPRHATLDATIGWSYELLSEGPRGLFVRLGVMSGRFLFDDVVAVCVSESVSPEAVRDWLSSLVDQSLVMAETSGTRTRYWLLETIRRFALAHLGDDEPEVRRRHAQYFARLAEFQAARLLTREEGDAFAELSSSHDNLRSAIGWAMETGDVDTASRIVASIPDWGYWRSRNELSRWAEWVWETTTASDPRWRAVCGSAARGAWRGGQFDDGIRFGRAGTDTAGTVVARSGHPDDVVADIALYRGDAPAALAHYSRVAAEANEHGDLTREVWATYYLAVINTVLRRPIEAVEAATKALAIARETGNPTALSFSLYAKGLAVKHQSPPEAVAMFEEAVRMADSVGNDWFSGIARMELASTRTSHGDMDRGFQEFSGVIDHWHRVGDATQLRLSWRYLVRALADVGLPNEAAMLTGALLVDTRSVLTHPHPRLVDELSDVLGDAEFARLTVRGSVMSVAELVVASLDAIDRAQHMRQDS